MEHKLHQISELHIWDLDIPFSTCQFCARLTENWGLGTELCLSSMDYLKNPFIHKYPRLRFSAYALKCEGALLAFTFLSDWIRWLWYS